MKRKQHKKQDTVPLLTDIGHGLLCALALGGWWIIPNLFDHIVRLLRYHTW